MGIRTEYPEAFERAWEAYPKWPKGRSVKQAAFRKWRTLTKENGWGAAEHQELVEAIEEQKLRRASWQPGDPYGPQGMQVWLNQHGWEHEYVTVEDQRQRTGAPQTVQVRLAEPWEIHGMTRAEWEAVQDWKWRAQFNQPQKFATIEEARAAAREAENAE